MVVTSWWLWPSTWHDAHCPTGLHANRSISAMLWALHVGPPEEDRGGQAHQPEAAAAGGRAAAGGAGDDVAAAGRQRRSHQRGGPAAGRHRRQGAGRRRRRRRLGAAGLRLPQQRVQRSVILLQFAAACGSAGCCWC